MKFLFAAVLLVVSVSVRSEPTWQGLRVTWGVNLLSSRIFAKLPMTESKARSDGYAKLPSECSGGKFLGHRYMKGLDTAAVLIFDDNGYIAGIQSGIPKNDIDKVNTTYDFAGTPAYQLEKILGEEEVYFATAYFVNPSIICNGGRSKEQFEEEGTGTGLYLQNGTDPLRDSVHVPLYEKDLEGTDWVKGQCFRTMGVHYWHKVREDMSCEHIFPFAIIYNRGKLTTFNFWNSGNYEFSRRFEHPPLSSLSMFLPSPVPQCIKDQHEMAGGISSMHVYFTVRPWNLFC